MTEFLENSESGIGWGGYLVFYSSIEMQNEAERSLV